MSRNKLIIVVFCIFSLIACSVKNNTSLINKYGLAVLEHAMGDYNRPLTFTGAIDSLYEIKRSSPQRRKVYVGLLDYYLGAGPGEILDKFIIEEGKDILTDLEQQLNVEINCMPEFNKICVKDKAIRNKRIMGLIDAIEKEESTKQ